MTIEFQKLLVEALQARLDATPSGTPEAAAMMGEIESRMLNLGDALALRRRRPYGADDRDSMRQM